MYNVLFLSIYLHFQSFLAKDISVMKTPTNPQTKTSEGQKIALIIDQSLLPEPDSDGDRGIWVHFVVSPTFSSFSSYLRTVESSVVFVPVSWHWKQKHWNIIWKLYMKCQLNWAYILYKMVWFCIGSLNINYLFQ